MGRKKAYDVALSFAGEDRPLAESVALELKRRGVAVFYDRLEQAELWGKDLYQHLSDVYRTRARFCLVFVSAAYARKDWARLELKSAQARALSSQREYILPVRLDDTVLPGLPPTVAYVDARRAGTEEIVLLVMRKLGRDTAPRRGSGGDSARPRGVTPQDVVYWKVLAAVNSHDPMELFPYASAEEYAEESRTIAALVPQAGSVLDLARSIQRVFALWFSPQQAGPVRQYLKLAHEIWMLTRNGGGSLGGDPDSGRPPGPEAPG